MKKILEKIETKNIYINLVLIFSFLLSLVIPTFPTDAPFAIITSIVIIIYLRFIFYINNKFIKLISKETPKPRYILLTLLPHCFYFFMPETMILAVILPLISIIIFICVNYQGIKKSILQFISWGLFSIIFLITHIQIIGKIMEIISSISFFSLK